MTALVVAHAALALLAGLLLYGLACGARDVVRIARAAPTAVLFVAMLVVVLLAVCIPVAFGLTWAIDVVAVHWGMR